jgi:hypothetical protein
MIDRSASAARRLAPLFAAPALALALACAGEPAPDAEATAAARGTDAAAPGEAATSGAPPALVSSAGKPASALPPGHPPIGDASGITTGVPPGAGADLAWSTPAGWVEETPSSGMRKAQYRVPGAAGDGELVVFQFAPGQGGDVRANAERWASQFTDAQGKPATEALVTREIAVGGIPVLLVEVSGTYDGGMAMVGAGRTLDDYRLLGAIAQTPTGNWFFKLTGPAATIEAQRPAFEALVESLRPSTSA